MLLALPTYGNFSFTLAHACARARICNWERKNTQYCHVQSSPTSFCDDNLKTETEEEQEEERKKESEKQPTLRSFIWQQRKSSKARLWDFFSFISIVIEKKSNLNKNRKCYVNSNDINNNDFRNWWILCIHKSTQ